MRVYSCVQLATGRPNEAKLNGRRATLSGTRPVDTRCVRSYALAMPRHPSPAPGPVEAPAVDEGTLAVDPSAPGEARPANPSLAGLGIAGISRRRAAWVGVVALAAWVVVGLAGQAASAAQATGDLQVARAQYAAAQAQTDALQRELALVTQSRWVLQQARAYQLGARNERPFALAPGAPSLPPDAPGSPARRVGAQVAQVSPLESWLQVLFGPAPAD